MRLVFPNAQRINRGGYVMKEICDACRSNDVTDLVILHEHRGQPGNELQPSYISAFLFLIYVDVLLTLQYYVDRRFGHQSFPVWTDSLLFLIQCCIASRYS